MGSLSKWLKLLAIDYVADFKKTLKIYMANHKVEITLTRKCTAVCSVYCDLGLHNFMLTIEIKQKTQYKSKIKGGVWFNCAQTSSLPKCKGVK